MVFRILVEKKEPHNVEAKKMFDELKNWFGLSGFTDLRIIARYDIEFESEDIGREIFERAKNTVFAEPATEMIVEELPNSSNLALVAIEPLPGQYDQTADTTAQCLQVLASNLGFTIAAPEVKCAKIYIFEGLSESELQKVKNYLINPVESRETTLDIPSTLKVEYEIPTTVETIDGFINLNGDELREFLGKYALAMEYDDILCCQDYFKHQERRDPTITEIRMLDAYWSDHCRHTTFNTIITDVEIAEDCVKEAFEDYLDLRAEVYGDKLSSRPVTMMDMATIAAKYLKKQGLLKNLDESEEVNACSVNIKVNIDGVDEDYLLMFKNETHNHPTEIEPFGGASTCLGGAIRDPLSGRSYVYQAMRITGAADPRKTESETIKNKLPQQKITRVAAKGNSSYGNQIGVAAGALYELYHEGYAAKRMELGAIVAATPKSNVRRAVPTEGDVIILVGGRTGRDGIGGAAGSSKSHTLDSLQTAGAEVQKGDAFEERKLLRLFRKPNVTQMIKRCNDFGAGGVSVAIGELADSIFVDLSLVPTKYDGLDGTELAISESQERMAVVVSAADCDAFIREAELESLEATKVAMVTNDGRLRMSWNGNQIVSLSREFLNSNGAPKKMSAAVREKREESINSIFNIMYDKIKNTNNSSEDIKASYETLLTDLNICGQKGIVDMFDSSAGGNTVIAPLGGEQRLSPAQFMAAKIPVLDGDTNTSSVMAYGFSPYISEVSPYRGALYAVVESVSKLIAAGVNREGIHLSFQEYFPAIGGDPKRFGVPFEALLGALEAQVKLELAAIGGKDSMSGTYTDNENGIKIDVPPTLVSFAVGTADATKIVSNEFKRSGSFVYLLKPLYNADNIVDFDDLKNLYTYLGKLIEEGKILSSYALGFGGIGEAVFKMCVGNGIGFAFGDNITQSELFASYYGAFIVESKTELPLGILLGETVAQPNIHINNKILDLNELTYKWLLPLEKIFPTELSSINEDVKEKVTMIDYHARPQKTSSYSNHARPRVLIPIFPGVSGEYEAMRHFEEAGALVDTFVFRNLDPRDINQSIDLFARMIGETQILMFPGGFSGGDGPVGNGAFGAAICRHPKITDAICNLMDNHDGLILGLGSGFQTLIKLGLLPYGEIRENMSENSPTITVNRIGRHQSTLVYTRVASVKSIWFSNVKVGDIHVLPISHGDGRFFASEETVAELVQNGQIAAQYCDINGEPTMHPYYNPSESVSAVEALFSPDWRILGKMGQNDRTGANIMKNVSGNSDQMIFHSGVRYFR